MTRLVNPCHEAAVRYAIDGVPGPLDAPLITRGLAVLPIDRTKRPLVPHGFNSATDDLRQIDSWWWRYPDAGVAVAVPPGIVIIDVDVDQETGLDGEASLRELEAGHEPLPMTYTVATPRGGRHFWYAHRAPWELRQKASILGPGIDSRVGGKSFIGMPPSRTDRGEYSVHTRTRIEWAPGWLLELLRPIERHVAHLRVLHGGRGYGAAALAGEVQRVCQAPQGQRNDSLYRSAARLGELVGAGVLDARSVAARLLDAALSIGLSEHEAESTITSGMRTGMTQPRGVP
ncbi:MAG TPA: bifunctional DNA primase/polymerase, partial [Acidimicrobiales bacterium]|nr:bifunctional DNA primase/polymerase [Acidimicrobiales bacterium]